MTAIVLAPPDPATVGTESARLDIFPGAGTPAVFPAHTPFWVGYGFTVEPEETAAAQKEVSPGTRFELVVDGEPVTLTTKTRVARGRVVGKQSVAAFRDGLPEGWHRFEGRWYEAGALALSSDRAIEFVEP